MEAGRGESAGWRTKCCGQSFGLKTSSLDIQEELMFQFKYEGGEKMMSSQGRQAGGIPLLSGRGSVFCSTQASNWWDEAHPHWGGSHTCLELNRWATTLSLHPWRPRSGNYGSRLPWIRCSRKKHRKEKPAHHDERVAYSQHPENSLRSNKTVQPKINTEIKIMLLKKEKKSTSCDTEAKASIRFPEQQLYV